MNVYTEANPPPKEMIGKLFWHKFTPDCDSLGGIWYTSPLRWRGEWSGNWLEIAGPVPHPDDAEPLSQEDRNELAEELEQMDAEKRSASTLAERVAALAERVEIELSAPWSRRNLSERVATLDGRVNAHEERLDNMQAKLIESVNGKAHAKEWPVTDRESALLESIKSYGAAMYNHEDDMASIRYDYVVRMLEQRLDEGSRRRSGSVTREDVHAMQAAHEATKDSLLRFGPSDAVEHAIDKAWDGLNRCWETGCLGDPKRYLHKLVADVRAHDAQAQEVKP